MNKIYEPTGPAIEEKQETATELLTHLNKKRKAAWNSTVESIDMKSSSRKAWFTINKLTGRKNISPNLLLIN